MQLQPLPTGFLTACERCQSIESLMFYLPLVGLVMVIVVMAWMQAREAALLNALDEREKTIRKVVDGFLQHIGADEK